MPPPLLLLARAAGARELARTLPDPASASGPTRSRSSRARRHDHWRARPRRAHGARSRRVSPFAPATGEAGTALDALCGELLAVAARDPAGCVADVDAARPVDAAAAAARDAARRRRRREPTQAPARSRVLTRRSGRPRRASCASSSPRCSSPRLLRRRRAPARGAALEGARASRARRPPPTAPTRLVSARRRGRARRAARAVLGAARARPGGGGDLPAHARRARRGAGARAPRVAWGDLPHGGAGVRSALALALPLGGEESGGASDAPTLLVNLYTRCSVQYGCDHGAARPLVEALVSAAAGALVGDGVPGDDDDDAMRDGRSARPTPSTRARRASPRRGGRAAVRAHGEHAARAQRLPVLSSPALCDLSATGLRARARQGREGRDDAAARSGGGGARAAGGERDEEAPDRRDRAERRRAGRVARDAAVAPRARAAVRVPHPGGVDHEYYTRAAARAAGPPPVRPPAPTAPTSRPRRAARRTTRPAPSRPRARRRGGAAGGGQASCRRDDARRAAAIAPHAPAATQLEFESRTRAHDPSRHRARRAPRPPSQPRRRLGLLSPARATAPS